MAIIDSSGLSDLAKLGFDLEELDDHTVVLTYNGKEISYFSPAVRAEALRAVALEFARRAGIITS